MGAEFDLAGYTNGASKLGKLVSTGRLYVPGRVWLSDDGKTLLWGAGGRQVEPKPEILHGFVSLHKKNPPDIAKFARKWGVLGFDKYWRPVGSGDRNHGEPISEWKYFSRRAQATLSIAARLKDGLHGELKDWQALENLPAHAGNFIDDLLQFGPRALWHHALHFDAQILESMTKPADILQRIRNSAKEVGASEAPWADDNAFIKRALKRLLRVERYVLAMEMEIWMRLGRVGFALTPVGSGRQWASAWELKIDYQCGLLSAIAFQVALTVAAADSLFLCSACSTPYVRAKKRPKAGQENYCDNCGRKAAVRIADRRRRARNMDKSGTPVGEIARGLGEPVSTVKGWLKT